MKYVVVGCSHATGARMRVEIDAANRAAAEKAAERSGVEVHHCHAANDDPVTHPDRHHGDTVVESKSHGRLFAAIGGIAGLLGVLWLVLH